MRAPIMPTNTPHGAKMKEGLRVKQRRRLCVWVERCPMCLGALERFHAPISNETHRARHTHTHTLLGILSAQLPTSDEKSMARGERQKNKDKQKREICYNMHSVMVAAECSNYSYSISRSMLLDKESWACTKCLQSLLLRK